MAMDLIVFDMLDFGIILMMDFLSQYGVEIEFKKKKVQFQPDNGQEFIFYKGHVVNMMVNIVKARKILSMGCTGYLAHIINKVDESILSLQDTPIVCEFQDLFLDNQPSQHLRRSLSLVLG